jgi:hypothetical protein
MFGYNFPQGSMKDREIRLLWTRGLQYVQISLPVSAPFCSLPYVPSYEHFQTHSLHFSGLFTEPRTEEN